MATIDILEERYKAAKKLQPCPFCGGTYKDTLTILADDYSRFYVICFSGRSGSGCGMESFRSYSLEDLVQRWNTRTEQLTNEFEPVRHGRWIQTPLIGYYECSACRHEHTSNQNQRFCSYCGAQMDGGAEEHA